MAYNYFRTQRVAARMIQKYGARCVLRRGSGDRNCFAAELEYDPTENEGKLINPTKRLFIVQAKDLAIPPVFGVDSFVTFIAGSSPPVENEVLRMVQPPGRLAPAGIVVYYEVWVN